MAVRASQDGLDDTSRAALQNEFNSLSAQIGTVVDSADFGGTNLVASGAEDISVLSSADGSTIDVGAQDLSTTGLGIDGLSLATAGDSQGAVAAIDAAIGQASAGLASLGASANHLENQGEATTQLENILQEGVGNLVDANLGEESALSQAQSIKQQLGVTVLSVANAGPASILALFR